MSFSEVVEGCRTLLLEYPGAVPARDYLASRLPENVWEKFGFGYYPPEPQVPALLSIVGEDVLLKSRVRYERLGNDGVVRKVKHNFFEHHNLVLPYRDVFGTIAAMVGRSIYSNAKLDELSLPRYKNSSFEKKSHVFGLFEAKKAILQKNCVFVVEGQFDCIMAHARGINNVVALGSSAMTLYQLCLMMRYTNNIYLVLDNDEAGVEGSKKIIERYGRHANFFNKTLPFGYKDLDDFLQDNASVTDLDLISL